MGKNLIQQARGKGGPRYRAPSFRYKGEVKHFKPLQESLRAEIKDIIHCAGHSAPLASVQYNNGEEGLIIAPEGIAVGDVVEIGSTEASRGNVMELANIPEGSLIHNIELQPGDGGKFVRSSGAFAKVLTQLEGKTLVKLPSKKEKEFCSNCRAAIGVVAGGGRLEKPFLKAGFKHHKMQAKNKLYPRVHGTSQNAVDHPFGGSSSSIKGRPTQSGRWAPPGRKVGKIAPKRTGRRK